MAEFLWSLWPLAVLAAMVLAAWYLLSLVGLRRRTPYARRNRLVTNSELAFYHSLRQAVRGDWEIFAMVRIADLLSVPRETKNHRAWLNRILSKHIDFILCDNQSLQVMVGIELDDRSHLRPDRIQRDQFINAAFADAGLPLIRIPAAREYDPAALRKLIDRAMR